MATIHSYSLILASFRRKFPFSDEDQACEQRPPPANRFPGKEGASDTESTTTIGARGGLEAPAQIFDRLGGL